MMCDCPLERAPGGEGGGEEHRHFNWMYSGHGLNPKWAVDRTSGACRTLSLDGPTAELEVNKGRVMSASPTSIRPVIGGSIGRLEFSADCSVGCRMEKPAARGLLSFLSLLRAFRLHVIKKRNQDGRPQRRRPAGIELDRQSWCLLGL